MERRSRSFQAGFETPMLPAYKRIRRILERKRRQLGADGETDGCRRARDRKMPAAELERRFSLIRQIADALIRIDHDEYGLYVRCGAEIAVARLRSIPWAPHCMECQEIAEIENQAPTSKWTGQQSTSAVLGTDPR